MEKQELLKQCKDFIYSNYNDFNAGEAQRLLDKIDELLLSDKIKPLTRIQED